MKHPLILAYLSIVLPCAIFAQERDSWLGKEVFIKDSAVLMISKEVVPLKYVPFPATVEVVEGDWLWLRRAWVQKSEVRDFPQALEYYTQKVRDNPADAAAWLAKGSVWLSKGDTELAMRDYNEALRLNPNLALAYNHRGIAWKMKGELANAIQDYSTAIRNDPKLASAYINRGNAWLKQGEYEKAKQDFADAIQLDPLNARAFFTRGLAASKHGEFKAAIEDYTTAIRLDAKHASAYHNRANVWQQLAEFDNAIQDYSAAIQLNPLEAKSYHNLAWLLATCPQENYRHGTRAVELALKACELAQWKNLDYLDTLAASYAEAGDWENALQRQSQFMNMVPTGPAEQRGKLEERVKGEE